jgi:reticulon-4-interacting protein 1, mitochondrial
VTIVGDKTSVTSLGGPITYITNPVQILRYIHGFIFGPRYACISMLMKSEYLERVAALGERGEVKCEVQEVIKGAFDEDGDSSTNYGGWKRAIKLIESSRIRGKVILEVP